MIRELNEEHIEVQTLSISQSFDWSFTQSFLWIGMYKHTINVIIKKIKLLECWDFWYISHINLKSIGQV